MNKIGISSACFYPLETEKSIEKLCYNGVKDVEIFFNSPCELDDSFVDLLLQKKTEYGLNFISMHPFGSFTESFMFFSSYERRMQDYLPLYRRFFEVANKLGIHIFVVHGAQIPGSISDDEYCERYSRMIDIANEYDVIFAHENVVHYRSGKPEYLEMMKNNIGSRFRTVLDIKQARREGYSPYEFIDRLGDSICHVHLSDYSDEIDCLAPGKGNFDFTRLFQKFNSIGYKGDYIVELYSKSFDNEDEIYTSASYLSELLRKN